MRDVLSGLTDAYSLAKQYLSTATGASEELLDVHAGW